MPVIRISPPTRLTPQSGMTLMEVMVALLILSIGLLGIAGLQTASVKASSNAYWESQGIWIAYDMADRLRANPAGVASGSYTNASVDGSEDVVTCNSGCNMVDFDLYEWGQRVATLPAGEGMISAGANGTFTISVMWDEVGGATGTGCDPTDPNDKTCIQVTVSP